MIRHKLHLCNDNGNRFIEWEVLCPHCNYKLVVCGRNLTIYYDTILTCECGLNFFVAKVDEENMEITLLEVL